MMPKATGLEVLKELQEFILNKNLEMNDNLITIESPRFIFCTAYSTLEFKRHLKSIGVSEVFEKPFQIEALQEQIELSFAMK
jgi:CheY-like chemotaxis protein